MRRPSQPPARPFLWQIVVSHRLRWLMGAALLLAVAAFGAKVFLQPAKPRNVVFTAGADEGIYLTFARRYAEALKKENITLDIRKSSGAVENYQRLKDDNSDYDIGLVQSGTGNARDAPNLQTLASVSFEPIWIFYRGTETIDRLSQLQGKRISVGMPGSGLRTVMRSLLAMHGVTPNNSSIQEFGGTPASQALAAGRLDAAAFIGAPNIPLIASLLNSDLKLLSFSQADAVVRRFPSLSKVVFPRGAIDLARDLPPHDVTLLSTTALLVAKNKLHTELAYQLLDAANEVHGMPSFFADRGDFPNQRIEDFPISDETRRYFKSGRPFLQNYLPFWLASFIEQRFVILVPVIAVFFALLQTLPRLYGYRMRHRLVRWYYDVKLLEDEILGDGNPQPEQRRTWQRRIDAIDAGVSGIVISQPYLRDVYALKQAIRLVHDKIAAAAPVTLSAEERSRII